VRTGRYNVSSVVTTTPRQGSAFIQSGTAIADAGDQRAENWNRVRAALVTAAVVIAALAVYHSTIAFGLFSDDFQWLAAARHVGLQQFIALGNHFYRPGTLIYFIVASSACGYTAPCYHALSIGLHVVTSLLVATMVALLSRQWQPGALAGILFAVQPASVEAAVWVSAISEVITTAWFVLTVLLFAYATRNGNPRMLIAAWVVGPVRAPCRRVRAAVVRRELPKLPRDRRSVRVRAACDLQRARCVGQFRGGAP
jgi:hypothetical protein